MTISRQRKYLILFIMIVYLIVPLFASQLYFRNDDSVLLLWSKEFNQPVYQAFSPDREVNNTIQYEGFGVYWRPFVLVYNKILWNIFGAVPAPYFIAAGILFILSIYFFIRITEKRTDFISGGLGALFYIIIFYNAFYNVFRINVTLLYFLQLAFLFYYYSYLKTGKWLYLLGALLLILPAMARMTTSVIMIPFLVLAVIEQKNKISVFSKRYIFSGIILLLSFYIIRFSSMESISGIFNLFPDISAMIAFLHERFMYYGSYLTSGLTGIMILFFVCGHALHCLFTQLQKKMNVKLNALFFIPVLIIVTFLFLKLNSLAPYYLGLSLILLYLLDIKSRLFVAWAAVSLASFMVSAYYHHGYILEAAFPLSAIVGTVFVKWAAVALKTIRSIKQKYPAIITVGIVFILLAGVFAGYQKKNYIMKRTESIRIFKDNNYVYSQIMNYIEHEHPENTIIIRFTEAETGMEVRRDIPIEEKAENMANMNIANMRFMIRVLNRPDLRIVPPDVIDYYPLPDTTYFLCLNHYERKLANEQYSLQLLKEFNVNHSSGALYRLLHCGVEKKNKDD